jgi:hypothetical protein
MSYSKNYNPAEDYDAVSNGSGDNEKALLENAKKLDRGYNKVYRNFPRSNGTMKRTKIEFYTSSEIGNKIRDAQTGGYYNHVVGSKDEYLYFKVGMSTGECKSSNGSNTLFFTSPYRYMSLFNVTLSSEIITRWEENKSARLNEIEKQVKKPVGSTVVVR